MLRSPVLTVNMSALAANYRLLRERFSGRECAAVVKADAYGLGAVPVAARLHQEGCRTFFVATLEEGIALRQALLSPLAGGHKGEPCFSSSADAPLPPPPASGKDKGTRIFIFHGPYAGEEKEYQAHGLIPVLNHPGQVERWLRAPAPFALHVDSGMCRLGLSESELAQFAERQLPQAAPHMELLISHLACGNEPEHPKTIEQLTRFRAAKALLPEIPASLCNSSGIFLAPDYHFDLARPGCALYGITPVEGENPMQPVVSLHAPLLQVRALDRDESVGYGATVHMPNGSRVAIVQIGYADGFFRCLSNRGIAKIGSHYAPVMGRVSMDMIALDVSALPEALLSEAQAELLGEEYTVNDLARDAGTIGYEVLTRMGSRVHRAYRN